MWRFIKALAEIRRKLYPYGMRGTYNVPKSNIIDKIAVPIQKQGSTQNQRGYFVVPEKKQCNDFESRQAQRVCFGGNHACFGGYPFLEWIPPTVYCPSAWGLRFL